MKKTSLLLVALMAGAFMIGCGKKEEPAKPAVAPAPASRLAASAGAALTQLVSGLLLNKARAA